LLGPTFTMRPVPTPATAMPWRPAIRPSIVDRAAGCLHPHLGHLPIDRMRMVHNAAMFIPAARASGDSVQRDAAVKQEQLITINRAAFVESDSGKRPKALMWTDEHVSAWRESRPAPGGRDGTRWGAADSPAKPSPTSHGATTPATALAGPAIRADSGAQPFRRLVPAWRRRLLRVVRVLGTAGRARAHRVGEQRLERGAGPDESPARPCQEASSWSSQMALVNEVGDLGPHC